MVRINQVSHNITGGKQMALQRCPDTNTWNLSMLLYTILGIVSNQEMI